MKNRIFWILGALLLTLTACDGLAGEPQIVATRAPATATPESGTNTVADVGYPQQHPDLASGARIFAARCAECHGLDGAGQGELVLDGQIPPMASFLDPATTRDQTPQDWFNTITNGRIENLMPPWKDALTEAQRWDVALYTYTLHITPEQRTEGEQLYAQECAECHGITGAGDGPEAANLSKSPGDLTDARSMVTISDAALHTLIAEGNPELMPAFADTLTPAQLDAVTAYTRTLSTRNSDDPAQAQATTTTTQIMDVSGTVRNRTPNGSVPSDLIVTLRTFDSVTFTPIESLDRTAPIDAVGRFTFEDVPLDSERVYLTAVSYQGRDFASGFAAPDFTQDGLTLDIDLFELTDDPAVIELSTGVIQIRVIGDSIEFQQFFQFSNTSDSVYTSLERGADNRYSALELSLPPGALVIGFDDERSYTIADDGSRVYDMRPLLPTEQRLTLVSYLVQYGGGAVIEIPLNYAINGEIRLLVQPDTVQITSAQLPYIGPEDVGGERYQAYGGPVNLAAGEALRFEISGQAMTAAQVGQQTSNVVSSDALAPTLIGAAALGLLIAAGVIYLVSRRKAPLTPDGVEEITPRDVDKKLNELTAEMEALERQHSAGEINHDLYHQKMATLRYKITALMEFKGRNSR